MGIPKQRLVSAPALGFHVRVVCAQDTDANLWARDLQQALNGMLTLDIEAGTVVLHSQPGEPQLLFVDASLPNLAQVLSAADRSKRTIFAIVREGAEVPSVLVEGLIDDVLVHPFRPLEVLSKLRYFQQLLEWKEASALSATYAQALERLQADLTLAERLQKSRLPVRFPDVRGFKVTSRYLAGVRSGGNFADLAETRDGQRIAMVLTDASSYRVSGAVLDALPRVMSQLTIEETRSSITSARRIRDGVLATLTEQDQLSLFYGVLSRKDYRLRFLNLGTSRLFYASPGKAFKEMENHGEAIVRATGVRAETEGELLLEPEGRLALVSEGFIKVAGGSAQVKELLDRFRDKTAADALNELVFKVKAPLAGPEDLPTQDCTAVIFDVDSRLIRLA